MFTFSTPIPGFNLDINYCVFDFWAPLLANKITWWAAKMSIRLVSVFFGL